MPVLANKKAFPFIHTYKNFQVRFKPKNCANVPLHNGSFRGNLHKHLKAVVKAVLLVVNDNAINTCGDLQISDE